MRSGLTPAIRDEMLRLACRHARRADEAEDLLQDAILAAVGAGRADLAEAANRRWLAGVIRNRATFAARVAARRIRREARWLRERDDGGAPEPMGATPAEMLQGLPTALKAVAALALSGHSRREIGYLLGLSDTALRQRLTALKRRLAAGGFGLPSQTPGLGLELAYGRIRDTLLPRLVREGGLFASHDPDGHLFIVRRSQTG